MSLIKSCLIIFLGASSFTQIVGHTEIQNHTLAGFTNNINEFGFFEYENKKLLPADFLTLYKKFDIFIDKTNNSNLLNTLNTTEKEFSNIKQFKKQYCSAPSSYRSYQLHPHKKHHKIYFQFTAEYHNFLMDKYSNFLKTNLEVKEFLDCMSVVDQNAKAIFRAILPSLECTYPGITQKLYKNNQELTVITKIVRYDKIDKWGTTAHFDKSALSLIWHSDEKNNDSLLICKNPNDLSVKNLIQPIRRFAQKDTVTSSLIIPGSAFAKEGIPIPPTLHGVAPILNEHRHAVISFLLIPNIDMSDLKTDFEEIDDKLEPTS